MINNYFNSHEANKIIELIKSNPYLARNMFEEYLKKYPHDYSIYCYYIDTLLMLGELKKAEKIIENTKELVNNNYAYLNNKEKMILFDRHMHYVMIKLLFLKGEYKKVLEYKNEHKKEITTNQINAIDIFCKKELGILNIHRENGYSYIHKQFIEYSEIDFLKHVKKHFMGSNEECKIENYFLPEFPIIEVVDEIKKYIPSDKVLRDGFGVSIYYFKYDNCGRYNSKTQNFIKVVCIDKTNNIITMYPISYCQDLQYIDLNYMVKEDNYEDLKKEDDRIAKFYKRFNKSKK